MSDQSGSSSGPAVVHTQPAPRQVTHSSGCGFLGLSCAAHAVSQSFDWTRHEVAAHWQGIAQIAEFAVCLTVSILLCLAAEAIDIGTTYINSSIQDNSWTGESLDQALWSVGIDGLGAIAGIGVGKLLDSAIENMSGGLVAATSDDTVKGAMGGITGKALGAYKWSYIPQNSADFVGANEATQFFAHPAPVGVQVVGRAAMNEAGCDGSSLPWCSTPL